MRETLFLVGTYLVVVGVVRELTVNSVFTPIEGRIINGIVGGVFFAVVLIVLGAEAIGKRKVK